MSSINSNSSGAEVDAKPYKPPPKNDSSDVSEEESSPQSTCASKVDVLISDLAVNAQMFANNNAIFKESRHLRDETDETNENPTNEHLTKLKEVDEDEEHNKTNNDPAVVLGSGVPGTIVPSVTHDDENSPDTFSDHLEGGCTRSHVDPTTEAPAGARNLLNQERYGCSTPPSSSSQQTLLFPLTKTNMETKLPPPLDIQNDAPPTTFDSTQSQPMSSPAETPPPVEPKDMEFKSGFLDDDDEKKEESMTTPPGTSDDHAARRMIFSTEKTVSQIGVTLSPHDPLQPERSGFGASPSRIRYVSPPGRRSIKLRLLEEVSESHSLIGTPFKKSFSLKRFRSLSLSTVPSLDEKSPSSGLPHEMETFLDRGTITVSWYEGTTSSEMQEHVWNCVLRKLNSSLPSASRANSRIKLEDVRLLDENVNPHEEVVLCPFLPSGSQFLLKFRTVVEKPPPKAHTLSHPTYRPPYETRAPDSPSAAPSPFPSSADLPSLNAQQMQLLSALLPHGARRRPQLLDLNTVAAAAAATNVVPPKLPPLDTNQTEFPEKAQLADNPTDSVPSIRSNPPLHQKSFNEESSIENSTDDLIEKQLRQLNELFLLRRESANIGNEANTGVGSSALSEEDDEVKAYYREEKKQVIFLLANYIVLFMSLIAVSAEIQSRLPRWMLWVQENYDSVKNCASDRDALFDCVSSGDFSGLVASFLLWATQSAAAKRIFLFGFDSPKRLWTVVYEAFVTAVCWGISYIFIRRGLNPDTRRHFLHKYWKDAVYGSLAGFNAAFLKAVLKNLIPQDVAREALETRQLKIVNWLGALIANEQLLVELRSRVN